MKILKLKKNEILKIRVSILLYREKTKQNLFQIFKNRVSRERATQTFCCLMTRVYEVRGSWLGKAYDPASVEGRCCAPIGTMHLSYSGGREIWKGTDQVLELCCK